eukprot:scaffold58725_cov31-Tisochrysis_lutea.AAC.7
MRPEYNFLLRLRPIALDHNRLERPRVPQGVRTSPNGAKPMRSSRALSTIVLNGLSPPLRVGRRVAVEAELHHEGRNDAEEARVVIEAGLNEFAEACGTDRRPILVHEDKEFARPVGRFHLELREGEKAGRGKARSE